eukprot:CAMPEP_0194271346 /NCGR_PEP_ID=MMETSP0169-20130528/5155_1 /TAXON_ID=218684 /ORGANISM="Corethron pennatum, Strain L29A3" /LENGTH=445 /DNA_ID=CAMNT_0039013673 /DNA_START=320 /DNA_END=1657 /DNA_ORIENTATION=+
MKVLNKAPALIALINIDYAVCHESGLHHLRPSATHDIETSPRGSSTQDVERDLQSLRVRRSTILEFWNAKRRANGIADLSISQVGNAEAQRMADQMADAKELTTTFDPAYGSTCLGSSFIMVGSYIQVDPVLNSWYDSDNGRDTATNEEIRYTGIGVSTRGSVIYMLQLYCNYNFVNSATVTDNANDNGERFGLRSRIMSHVETERRTKALHPIIETIPFQFLAQTWAEEAAKSDEITEHNNGRDSYGNKCYGVGGEVGAAGGSESAVESDITSKIGRYLEEDSIRYTGIGIAQRNDGKLYFVQVFCSLEFQLALPDPPEPSVTEKMVTNLIEKENKVQGRRNNKLKVSSVTSGYAQEWADELVDGNAAGEDPELNRGCGGHSFQVVATGKSVKQILQKIRKQKGNKFDMTIKNPKVEFVGTGIREIEKGYLVVQNYCTWKPDLS